MIMNDFLARSIVTIGTVLLTEFIIRVIVYNMLYSLFPNRKWKTIRRMMKRNRFIQRINLLYLLEYDDSYKTKLCVIICYVYRAIVLWMLYTIWFTDNLVGGTVFFLWCMLLVIPGVIWLNNQKNRF